MTPRTSDMFFMTMADGAKLRAKFMVNPRGGHRGTIVMLPGNSSFIEKFDPVEVMIEANHFNFFCFDWRGQGSSHRQLLDPNKSHIDHFGIYVSDLARIMENYVLPLGSQPVYFLAESMGGNIALRYLSQHASPVKALILAAPMLGILTAPYPWSMAKWIAKATCWAGFATSYALGQRPLRPYTLPFETNDLSTYRDLYYRVREYQFMNPHLVNSGVTWGWLKAAMESVDVILKDIDWGSFSIPVLLALSGREGVVDNQKALQWSQKISRCRVRYYPDAAHLIMGEKPEILANFWQDINVFLADTEESSAERRIVEST
ncbi:MAG: alpha/beta fold hydrolase [Holosporales bacterium]